MTISFTVWLFVSTVSLLLLQPSTVFGSSRDCGTTEGIYEERWYAPCDITLPDCTKDLRVTMRLYTRPNKDCWKPVNRTGSLPNEFNPSRQTWFIIHGFRTTIDEATWMTEMKSAALNLGDFNIILVGWDSKEFNYPLAASDTRTMGAMIGGLAKENNLSTSNLYCVGHSLGAQICGLAGKKYKFGRITACDPAGPYFDSTSFCDTHGLDSSSANFVDVIHTDMTSVLFPDSLGSTEQRGHVDFYPNGGGAEQPGCQLMSTDLSCSHSRSHDYFTSSLQQPSDCFPANLDNKANQTCMMGYYAAGCQLRGKFYLSTTASSPFCKKN